MNIRYILDEQDNPIMEPDLLKWAEWFETTKRSIAKDTINEVLVSTVFLGLNHNFGDGNPVLWETMIFGGEHDQYQERYTTKKEALEGHRKAIEMVMKS